MNFFISQILNPQNYFFSLYGFFHVVVCVIIIILSMILLKRENFSNTSLSFFFMAVTLFLWLGSNAVMFSSSNKPVLMWWIRVENIGVIFLQPALFLLTLSITNKFSKFKGLVILSFIFSFVFAILAVSTNYFITGIYHYWWGYYTKYHSVPSAIYLILFLLFGGLTLALYYSEYRNALSKRLKGRYLVILILYAIAFIGGLDYINAYGISFLPPIGVISTFLCVCVAFVFINRYEFTEVSPGFAAHEIIKTMNDMLILFNKDGIIQFVNSSALRFFNIPESDFIGKHILQIIQDPKFSQDFYSIMREGFFQDYEVSYERDKEAQKILNLSFFTIRNGLRQPIAVVCIAKDKTEDKKAEDDMNKAYDVPVKIIEGVPISIIVMDRNKKVRQINKAALKLLELTSEGEILNKTYITKESNDKNKTGPSVPSEGKQSKEAVIVTPGGKEVAVLKTSLPVLIGDENLFLDVLININERKAMEEQLKEYKEYLEKLVKEKTQELKDTNSQLLEEVSERKRVEEDLRFFIDDLEKFKKITKDRNNKLIELKKEANQLALELGKPEKYTI